MKNHPIKKEKLWHRLILILSIYLTACTAYHVFSASRHTTSSSSQKSDDQLDIPDLNFNRLLSPSPCSFFMSLSSRNMYSPSPFPLNNAPFLPFSKNLSFGVVTDSVKKEWFESVTKDDLPSLQHILSNYIFDVDEVSQKGDTAFLMACELKNQRIATYLLNIGANKFVQNNDGRTAFHLACIHGHKALAAWLLTLGLSKYALDHEGNNALDLVDLYGYHVKQEMCVYLLFIGLQRKAVREKSQFQSLSPSHISSVSSFGNRSTHQQAISAPVHENFADEEESKDIAAVTLVPIAMSKRSKKKFPCTYCPKGYARKDSLIDHLFFHTDPKSVTCPICKEIKSSRRNLVSHLITHKKDRPYACSHCNKRFKANSHLREHVRTHNSEKPHECNECHKRFRAKSTLKAHIKNVHKKERPFKCTICPRAFKRKPDLKRHVKKIHVTKPKVHACKYCTEKFVTVHELKRHERIHTGEATDICPTCKKSFSCKSSLNRHIRGKHPSP